MHLDTDKYRARLNAFPLNDEEKDELMRCLWSIAESAVLLDLGLDSTQTSLGIDRPRDSVSDADPVEFEDHLIDEFQRTALTGE
jgi:hypothetical protein